MKTIINADDLSDQLHAILRKTFQFDEFRPGQLEAITELMQSGRLICLQPTGHGKSLLYQLPATLLPGITVVISPLLALMRDQATQLNDRFNIAAASINSDQSEWENNAAQQAAQQGELKILFVAPEKLDHITYFDFLLRLPINLIVIDEAHCISTWGHDFRPSYRQIINFIRAVEQKNNELKVLAITATANQKTETDIKQQLENNSCAIPVQRHSMDRHNLKLSVITASNLAEKLYYIAELLQQLPGHGLIYCATRENTELVAEYLQSKNVSSAAYHAGLPPDQKRKLQTEFINNQYKVITATNALGMGIDKQDLRFIIHFDVPGSITAYYQEVGRCGRDGNLAHGILLFNEADKKIQQYFISSAQPTQEDFEHIIDCITNSNDNLGLTELKRISGRHPTQVNIIISELLEQQFLSKKSIYSKQVYCLTGKTGQPDLSRYQNQFHARMHELNEITNYGQQTKQCLMLLLRKALGDTTAKNCGRCHICSSSTFKIEKNSSKILQIKNWLSLRTTMLDASPKYQLASGLAFLNAQLRSPSFIEFMQQRATAIQINHELLDLLKQHLLTLKNQYSFSTVIPIPSRTWASRNYVAQFIADFLQVSVELDYLQWQKIPTARQGELLNNDQRRFNVHCHMHANTKKILPKGTILLVDDYTGSGATLQEAARVLSMQGHVSQIVPLTIAAVKWRLGKRGMV